MIRELKELIQENPGYAFESNIKVQMIHLYKQLSISEDIPHNEFLKIILNNHIFIDVDEEFHIIGTITVLLEQKILRGGSHVAHIEDLVVDANSRKRGIGKNLVHHAIEFAKNKECYKIILNCTMDIFPFYEICGFNRKNVEMSMYL
tara:strand:+ start:378 stop:818 length:441 start_codon:yes stop_codon:yes gene_type:complete